MQTIESTGVADRKLYRLVDVQAANEAAAALHSAAKRSPQDGALVSAAEVLRGDSEAARDRLREFVLSQDFKRVLPLWAREMREAASAFPDSGACTVATALKLWSLTFEQFRAGGGQAVDDLTEALCPLIAARSFVLDAVTSKSELRLDLCHVYAAHASAQTGTTCAEIVFGYRRHLMWDAEGCSTCYVGDDLDELEAFMPGIASGARASIDVIETDGSHPSKRGPCVRFDGLDTFMRWRNRLDGCLTGARIAKDRAAAAIARRS